jgi:hypothetical protein
MYGSKNEMTRDRGIDLEEGGTLPFTPPREINKKKSNDFADSLSPATTDTTADETLASPTRAFDEVDPSPTRITVDHNVKTSRGGGSGARSPGLGMFGMTKPVLAIVAALFLTTSGAGAYLLNGFLKIPGLESQIERLNEQVERLNTESIGFREKSTGSKLRMTAMKASTMTSIQLPFAFKSSTRT